MDGSCEHRTAAAGQAARRVVVCIGEAAGEIWGVTLRCGF